MTHRIEPQSAVAFTLRTDEYLTIIDPQGEQVADLVAFNSDDPGEYLSSGRSIDYASRLFLTTGDLLYSNRSQPMFAIVHDDVGRHDFTLTPCSRDTFRIIYNEPDPLPGCQGNLEKALQPFGIGPDRIPIAFNVFMHVVVNSSTGVISVEPPLSCPGDALVVQARQNLIVGLTACSAGQSNNFRFKPIDYAISNLPPRPRV